MINLAQIGSTQEEHVRWYKAKAYALFLPWPPSWQQITLDEMYCRKYISRQNVPRFLTNVLCFTEMLRNPREMILKLYHGDILVLVYRYY